VSLNSLTAKEKAQLEAQLHSMSIVPVFIDDEIAASAYYGFCKQIMWPVFHNVDQLDQIHSAWNLQDDFRQARPLPANSLPQVIMLCDFCAAPPVFLSFMRRKNRKDLSSKNVFFFFLILPPLACNFLLRWAGTAAAQAATLH